MPLSPLGWQTDAICRPLWAGRRPNRLSWARSPAARSRYVPCHRVLIRSRHAVAAEIFMLPCAPEIALICACALRRAPVALIDNSLATAANLSDVSHALQIVIRQKRNLFIWMTLSAPALRTDFTALWPFSDLFCSLFTVLLFASLAFTFAVTC